MDDIDLSIASLFDKYGSTSYTDAAEVLGLSPATMRRRMDTA
jgi:DNA-binding Lrp family transcriptional regulator